MKKKAFKKFISLLLVFTFMFAFTGCGGDTSTQENESETETEAAEERIIALEDGTRTFGYYSELAQLQQVPAMVTERDFFTHAELCNDSCAQICAQNTTKEEYDAYLALLKKEGFELFADSGADGINNNVYFSAFQKDGLTLYVTYHALQNMTGITAGMKENLSPNMIYSDSYTQGISEDAKNIFMIPDMALCQELGAIFKLKNGHFILIDGGVKEDYDNFFNHLFELAPEGEKPVIDAWFLTHAHSDHIGVMEVLCDKKTYADRIICNGIYYNKPTIEWMTESNSGSYDPVDLLTFMLKDENGNNTPLYRPLMGERFYFGDINIEIVASTDFVRNTDGSTDFNDTSTQFIMNVDGQKVLITGDGERGLQLCMIENFDREYFDLDIYQVPHHGYGTFRPFLKYVTIKTAVFPSRFLVESSYDEGATHYLMETASEYYYLGNDNGTLQMTFPYKTGDMEILGNDFNFYRPFDSFGNDFTHGLYIEG